MTANRDLKRRVRDRQAQTGESYMTALHHVLAQRPGGIPSAIPTVEFVDVTAVGEALGLTCRVSMSPTLAHAVDVGQTLGRFRDMLATTAQDPALSLMRRVVLRGEHVPQDERASGFQQIQDAARFVRRVRAGLGGVSASGQMLALRAVPRRTPGGAPPSGEPDDQIAVFELCLLPGFAAARPPLLVILSLGESVIDLIVDRFPSEAL